MAWLTEALGGDAKPYTERADRLKTVINEKFWDEEKHAYIDTYTSGRRNVTRHAAIFAILYDFVDRKTADDFVKNILENDSVTKITTPYFELYELMAFCKLGHIGYAQNMIDSYWGGMLKLGATTIWEQYDPTESGVAHYGMYGNKFGKPSATHGEADRYTSSEDTASVSDRHLSALRPSRSNRIPDYTENCTDESRSGTRMSTSILRTGNFQ